MVESYFVLFRECNDSEELKVRKWVYFVFLCFGQIDLHLRHMEARCVALI